MTCIDRRAFLSLSGGTAALALLPLSGCGGGGDDDVPPVTALTAAQAPLRAALDGPQFQVVGRAHALIITGSDGRQRSYGGVGRTLGKLNYPAGVAAINGMAYVVETGNHRVQVFDSIGMSRGVIGNGELFYPGGIAAGQSEIFVSDSRNSRVVGFTLDGRIRHVLGAGILSAPRGLVVQGNSLLVADPGLRKVLRIGFDGRLQGVLGTGWVLPWDVATDGKNAYVADASRNEIGVVTLSGKTLASLPLAFAPANVAFKSGALQVTPLV